MKTKLLPDGHVVVFSESTEWAHVLTPTAALVWEFCDGLHSLEQIIQEVKLISEEHDTPLDIQNIPVLLEELQNNGLLETT